MFNDKLKKNYATVGLWHALVACDCVIFCVLDLKQVADMSQEKPVFDYHDESQSEKLMRKTKESPFMVLAIAGCAGAVGYGGWAYKNRGAMSTSVFLMQFRVIAQGTAVGALCAGMVYTLYNNHFNKPKENLAILPKSNEH